MGARVVTLSVVIVLGLGVLMPAAADPITFYMTGRVDSVQGPVKDVVGVPVVVGMVVPFSVTFDPLAPSFSGCGNCREFTGPPYGMELGIGVQPRLENLLVAIHSSVRGIDFSAAVDFGDSNTMRMEALLYFSTAPFGHEFPRRAPPLNNFAVRHWFFARGHRSLDPDTPPPDDLVGFGGEILTLTDNVGVVPEPSTLVLFVTGVVGVLARRRAIKGGPRRGWRNCRSGTP
jgi:hypothetical protein